MAHKRRNSRNVALLVPAGEVPVPAARQTGGRKDIATFTLEDAYQSVPALPEPLSDAEVIRIAKEERVHYSIQCDGHRG